MKVRILFIVGALFCWQQAAWAASGWEWQMSLKADAKIGYLKLPTSLFIDIEKERYYVVDSGNNRLISYDKDGKSLSIFNANQALDTPLDMIRDRSGVLWVVERGRNALTKIDLKAKTVTPLTIKDQDRLIFPDRLEIFEDMMYVLDKGSGALLVLNQDAQVMKTISCAECQGGITDFKITAAGEIWALGQGEKTLYHFTRDGEFDKKILLNAKSLFPVSFDLDASGLFYVLDRFEGNVVVFDQEGQVKYSFLGKGHVRGRLSYPIEIRFDPWGRLCVVDEGNGRVEIFGR